ncbi:MAG: hypothetical protein Tsb005_01830 [Gammaproteobacteria bacterium]
MQQALNSSQRAYNDIAHKKAEQHLKSKKNALNSMQVNFVKLGIGQNNKNTYNKKTCSWVVASTRHEHRSDSNSYYSQVSYGGVALQPNIKMTYTTSGYGFYQAPNARHTAAQLVNQRNTTNQNRSLSAVSPYRVTDSNSNNNNNSNQGSSSSNSSHTFFQPNPASNQAAKSVANASRLRAELALKDKGILDNKGKLTKYAIDNSAEALGKQSQTTGLQNKSVIKALTRDGSNIAD